jgi:hypothetical protein
MQRGWTEGLGYGELGKWVKNKNNLTAAMKAAVRGMMYMGKVLSNTRCDGTNSKSP